MTLHKDAEERNGQSAGARLREAVHVSGFVPLAGIYDVFSATLAARHFAGLFVSGFGFSASYYGLPDIGFNSWSDIVDFVHRLRAVLPTQHIVVDIDDGFADTEVACHVVRLLEQAGASGIILEDQSRPRRCGHLKDKQVLPLVDVMAYGKSAADAVLVDGLADLSVLQNLKSLTEEPLAFNQIAGGATEAMAFNELRQAGVSIPIFSTPCLVAAQHAITEAMRALATDGMLDTGQATSKLADCLGVLDENMKRRDSV